MELESKLYRLEETRDAIDKSLFDLNNIINKNTKLINILTDDEDFTDFVDRLKKQNDEYNKQVVSITDDKQLILDLIDIYKNDEKIAKAIDLCFTALIKN